MAPPRFPAWQSRDGLARIARFILADAEAAAASLPPSLHPDFDAVFYVYGEPAIFYHLEALVDDTSLRFVSQPAGTFEFTRPGATDPTVATFLITGMHTRADPDRFDQATRDLERIAAYEYTPSDLVWLDEAAGDRHAAPTESVQLFLLHPPLGR